MAAVAKYQRHFPNRRMPSRLGFSNAFKRFRDTRSFSSFCISSEHSVQNVAEEENFNQKIPLSHDISTPRTSTSLLLLLLLLLLQTRVCTA
jgi:hypothetical protein